MKNKYSVIRLDEVDSTNEYIKREYKKFDDCVLVVADKQTSGRGRNGRKFESSHEGIFMTMYFTNIDFSFTKMSACIAVSIVQALKDLYQVDAKIKWVNDIILDEKKLGGILCETSYKDSELEYALVGIGLNISEALEDEIKESTTYLNKYTTVNKDQLIEEIWNQFLSQLHRDEEFISKYRLFSNTIGRRVKVSDSSSSYDAQALAIDDEGCLLVSLEDGSLIKLSSAEIHIQEGELYES